MTDLPAATLAILAGGRGSRMGGTKDRLTVGGRPILQHLLDRVRHDGPTVLVTSPEHPKPIGWDHFDQVAFDPVAGEGPLAGMLAGLAAATTPVVCFLSVDMPGVGAGQVRWLRAALAGRPAAAGLLGRRRLPSSGTVAPDDGKFEDRRAVADPAITDFTVRLHAKTRGGAAGLSRAAGEQRISVEPFPSAFRVALAAPILTAHWNAVRRSLRSLLDLPQIEAVDAPTDWPADVWANLNRPEDLSNPDVKMG